LVPATTFTVDRRRMPPHMADAMVGRRPTHPRMGIATSIVNLGSIWFSIPASAFMWSPVLGTIFITTDFIVGTMAAGRWVSIHGVPGAGQGSGRCRLGFTSRSIEGRGNIEARGNSRSISEGCRGYIDRRRFPVAISEHETGVFAFQAFRHLGEHNFFFQIGSLSPGIFTKVCLLWVKTGHQINVCSPTQKSAACAMRLRLRSCIARVRVIWMLCLSIGLYTRRANFRAESSGFLVL